MSNYRVIVSGNSGDGFEYRIEDVYLPSGSGTQNVHPFVKHVGGSRSVSDLKAELLQMVAACDKPPMCIIETVELKEVG